MPRDRDDDERADIVKRIFALAREVAADIPESQWRAIEREAKARFGGQRVYVPRLGHQRRARRARSSSDMPT